MKTLRKPHPANRVINVTPEMLHSPPSEDKLVLELANPKSKEQCKNSQLRSLAMPHGLYLSTYGQ